MTHTDGLLLLGSNSRTRACLDALMAAREPVCALALDRDAPEFAAHARSLGLDVLDARAPRTPEGRAVLAEVRAQRWVMAGYARILPPEVLSLAPSGVLNLHGGRLPAYRGASVINWQLIEGEDKVGLTVLFADEGIDTGDILDEETLTVGPDEDYGSVRARMEARFPTMLLGVLDALRHGHATPRSQDRAAGRTWPRRRPDDGWIDWSTLRARKVHDLVRAVARPCPGAFTSHHGHALTVWQSTVVAEHGVHGTPGTVVAMEGDAPLVAAREGLVMLRTYDGDAPRIGEVLGGVRCVRS